MFTRYIGIDLGTANTLIYARGRGIIMREPSVVAVNTRTDQACSVGKEAKEIIGRTPGSVIAVKPLKDGVIADFDIAATMLQELIKKALRGSLIKRARVIICIPSGVTAVERRAVKEAAEKAGARPVQLVSEPVAAALGAGLPILEPTGTMVIDIGGGTTEIAVISMGGIVSAKSIRVGGDAFDQAIVNYIRKKYSQYETEMIGVDIGCLRHQIPGGMLTNLEMQLKGMNAYDRLPEALKEAVEVRKDFGYPPLGTPSSQIVGAQAVMNVITGERYKMLPKQTKDYVRGMYGKQPGEMNPELIKKALGDEQPISCRPADLIEPQYEKLRAEAGSLARSEEDVLTYAMFPAVASEFLKRKYGIAE